MHKKVPLQNGILSCLGRKSPCQSPVPDLFVSQAKEKESVQQIQEKLKKSIKECYPDTAMLISKIESEGFPLVINGPEIQLRIFLMLVGAQPGFIAPTLVKYKELTDTIQKYFPGKENLDYSNGMMILLKDTRNFTFIAYQFYHAMAFKSGLDGYQHRARKLYEIFSQKYNGQLHPKFLEKMDHQETAMLKMAIRRDKEALQFVRQILNEVFIPSNNGKLLESGEAQA